MKKLEEIERLLPSALESLAENSDIPVPENMSERVKAALVTAALDREERRRVSSRRIWGGAAAFAATACAAVLLIFHTGEPKDTYSDPEMAYAELERSFALISSKVDKGVKMASATESAFETLNDALN